MGKGSGGFHTPVAVERAGMAALGVVVVVGVGVGAGAIGPESVQGLEEDQQRSVEWMDETCRGVV